MKNIKRTHDLTGQKFGKLTVIGIDDRGELAHIGIASAIAEI